METHLLGEYHRIYYLYFIIKYTKLKILSPR